MAQQWCKSRKDIPYFETSAKDGSNVEIAFELIAKNFLAQELYDEPVKDVPITLKLEENKKKSSNKCC